MRYLKLVSKILLTIITLALVIAAIAYFVFMTPQKRAAAHLEFIHKSITEMHPAAVDPSNIAFQAWFKSGYDQAKALLPQVHSHADEQALLTFYLAGYQDSHLAGWIVPSLFTDFGTAYPEWTGWVLRANSSGYSVALSLKGQAYPAVGSQILSCDGQAIDDLLQTRYAPFVDRRWHLLNARDKTAQAFTQSGGDFQVLNRPAIASCKFKEADGNEKTYAMTWQTLAGAQREKIQALNLKPYSYPSLTRHDNNLMWINVGDFKLRSPEAYQHHNQLLDELKKLHGDETLVFDLRLNGGGNSGFGHQIFSAAFGEAGFVFAAKQLNEKTGPNRALYRPSWSLYWVRDYQIKQLRQAQGSESANAKWLEAVNLRLKKALENNETSFTQQETLADLTERASDASSNSTEQPVWNYRGQVIILTSKRCVSACLDFMDVLKQIPSVLHWGEQTNADTVYTEVAEMWHDYHGDPYEFLVPVKQWSNRLRKDNEPYNPDIVFDGNIYDDKAVEQWVMETLKTLSTNSQTH